MNEAKAGTPTYDQLKDYFSKDDRLLVEQSKSRDLVIGYGEIELVFLPRQSPLDTNLLALKVRYQDFGKGFSYTDHQVLLLPFPHDELLRLFRESLRNYDPQYQDQLMIKLSRIQELLEQKDSEQKNSGESE
ncbi:MAG: hypothetical protein OXI72_12570 [Gemmatimonadota bacterium]|nr:hypothetical protein [Gemmatimonadota bacterium]